MALHMLTTIDNPYNPFTDYDEWYAFDLNAGYHTPGMLARVIITSRDMSDADQDQAYEDAIEEILQFNVLGLYRKVSGDEEQG